MSDNPKDKPAPQDTEKDNSVKNEPDNPTPESKDAPINPFDPANFAASTTAAAGELGVEPLLVAISVRKPNKYEFFRTSRDPDFSLIANVIELKEERETYLVRPEVVASLPGDTVLRNLTLWINRQGVPSIWPLAYLPPGERARNEWHPSAIEIAAIAQHKWVRMKANMSAGRYDCAIAPGIDCEPSWPSDKSMAELLELAFGKERLIVDRDHPLIRRLLGVE